MAVFARELPRTSAKSPAALGAATRADESARPDAAMSSFARSWRRAHGGRHSYCLCQPYQSRPHSTFGEGAKGKFSKVKRGGWGVDIPLGTRAQHHKEGLALRFA